MRRDALAAMRCADLQRSPFSDTRRTNERWIVLSVAKEDVDEAGDFRLSTANGLETAGACVRRQVAREAPEGAARSVIS